jgi:YbbR domain-containing protein
VLSGSGALVKSVTPDQVNVRLDITNAVIGSNSFAITPEDISLPPGIVLREVTPPTVDVVLDETIKKQFPVQVDWAGKLSSKLILLDFTMDPETIEIMGGKRILENISTIYTEKVPLDNLKGKGEITAKLVLNPAALKIAPGSKDKVTIRYLIREREKTDFRMRPETSSAEANAE